MTQHGGAATWCRTTSIRTPSRRARSSCATSTRACSPASASASWAPTARASRRWSRRSSRSMPALGGEMTEGKGLSIGYFAQQEMDVVHADDTPLQHMVRLARDRRPRRPRAGAARLPRPVPLRRRHGAPGRSARCRAARRRAWCWRSLVWQRPNLLLMDEPTNHLDLTTREALSMALNEFEGTVMLVSHDRALLREVCDEFWLVAARRGAAVRRRPRRLPEVAARDLARHLARPARAAAAGQPQRACCRRRPRRRRRAKPAKGGKKARTSTRRRAAPAPAPAPGAATPSPARRATTTASSRRRSARRSPRRRARCASRCSRSTRAWRSWPPRRPSSRPRWPRGKLGGAEIADAGRRLAHVGAEVAKLEERWLELTEQIEALQAGG